MNIFVLFKHLPKLGLLVVVVADAPKFKTFAVDAEDPNPKLRDAVEIAVDVKVPNERPVEAVDAGVAPKVRGAAEDVEVPKRLGVDVVPKPKPVAGAELVVAA